MGLKRVAWGENTFWEEGNNLVSNDYKNWQIYLHKKIEGILLLKKPIGTGNLLGRRGAGQQKFRALRVLSFSIATSIQFLPPP